MKKIMPFFLLVCFLIGITIDYSCKKDKTLPTLTTTAVTNVTINSATSGGSITNDGGAGVTARGVCWSTDADPTTGDSFTTDATGTGSFTSQLTNLNANTLYHVRAYATNSVGTAYGNDVSFTTSQVTLAVLTTAEVTSISLTTAVSGGNITADGGGSVTARGICWATTENPDLTKSKTTDGTGNGVFVSNMTDLLPATLYHVRAYATNSAGTAYGNDLSFTTSEIVVPTLTTADITSITLTTAVSGGTITSDGGATISDKGVCWATTLNPVITDSKASSGTGTGTFVTNITGLTAGVTYHVRAYATNSAGTAYGNDIFFTATPVSLATLTTTTVTLVGQTVATSGGNITADGGGSITARGVCWSTTLNPTTAASKTSDNSGPGIFVSNITGLLPATLYHVRAYAVNAAGTAYGQDLTFTTDPIVVPTLTTTIITAVTQLTAESGGTITSDGGGAVTERGVCWATTLNPTTTNPKTTDGAGTGNYPSSITGLSAGTLYHVRAYATNSAGTAYGNDRTFTTSPAGVAVLTTTAVTSITTMTAVSGGDITSDGGGAVTARGVCWATTTLPTTSDAKTTDASGTGVFVSNLSSLLPGTTYHVRAYATNNVGTSYGNEITFTTDPTDVPTLTTTAVTLVTLTSASSGGNINVAGAGIVSARGICFSTNHNPTISDSPTDNGTGTGGYPSLLTGLTGATVYYVRAYATNSVGTGYGNEVEFSTKVADEEGNAYSTVLIGTQLWMSENLKTQHYANGDTINTIDGTIWAAEFSSYQWAYNDNANNEANTYGRLYNFYAATDPRGVCPTGFHVPTDAEWTTLSDYLGTNGFGFGGNAANIAKALASTSGWTTDPTPGDVGNDQATNNTSGFNAVPGGFRNGDGLYQELGASEYIGSSTPNGPGKAFYRAIQYQYPYMGTNDYGPWNGYAIRCVK
jgi:uncharacterized protein (TIGR02145 family)